MAFHIIFVGIYANRYSATKITYIQISVCALLSLAGAFVFEDFGWQSMHQAPKIWVELVFCGVVATALAFLIQNAVQKYISSVRTAIILTCEPVFGALFAYVLAHEKMTPTQWVGGGLMLIGVLISELAPFFKRRMALKNGLSSLHILNHGLGGEPTSKNKIENPIPIDQAV